MLSKKFRLQRGEIKELKSQKNKVIQGRFFGLVYRSNSLVSKFGVIVSNKISLKSTERNKIRRLAYGAITNKLLQTKGLFLFLAKKSALNADLREVENEMEGFKNKLT